ncbi:MAG: DUF1015 domain-containing protein [Candidatus Omnitrophota bacterium]|nr:DUF1015 domain-containing protein [Candidatus Omnitrophota bacterium]
MTQIKAFPATVYNQEKIKNIEKVFCPPYDIVSTDEQEYYYKSHPNNFIRLILNKTEPADNSVNNRYSRAKKTFEEWQKDGILNKDKQDCIYFYLQEYVIRGEKRRRLGFIALMRLQDEAEKKIFPHENTHLGPKEDRLELLKNVQANLSPIFVLFSDKEKNISRVFSEKLSQDNSFIDITDKDKVNHKLWRLTDDKLINRIVSDMRDKSIFIADGHHRYEVALGFRSQMIAKKGSSTGKEDFNYILTYFTNLDSKDLLILPTHRVVKKLTKGLDFLEEYFRVEKVKNKNDLLILLAKAGMNEHAFGLYQKDKIRLLRLKSDTVIDKIIKEGSADYRRLDVTILKNFILDRLDIISEDLIFTNGIDEAMRIVDDGQADVAFLLNSIKVSQLRDIAVAGERMPPKTTYFYPKVLSGLVVNKLERF